MFIPVIFMGGIVGRLLNEFAVTIVIAIVVSGIVSVTLTPMLCSRIIKSRARGPREARGLVLPHERGGFDAMQRGYERSSVEPEASRLHARLFLR